MTRLFTVSGDAVVKPHTMEVRIGTSCRELLEAAGGIKPECTAKKILCGGPMMGIAMSTLDVPIAKNNNALTVLAEDEVELAENQYDCLPALPAARRLSDRSCTADDG